MTMRVGGKRAADEPTIVLPASAYVPSFTEAETEALIASHNGREVPIAENRRALKTEKKVRQPSGEWVPWVLALLDEFEILEGRYSVRDRSRFLDRLQEFCEMERLDAVRLDRQRREADAERVAQTALDEIAAQADLADRVALLEASLHALAHHTVFDPPARKKTPRARRKKAR